MMEGEGVRLSEEEEIVHYVLVGSYVLFALYIFVLAAVLKEKSPYGRHHGSEGVPAIYSFFPDINVKLAWFIMELPSSLFFALSFALSYILQDNGALTDNFFVPLSLFLLWELHYFQRTFIWVFCVLKPGSKKMNSLVSFFGFMLNCLNSYTCSTAITRKKLYPLSYFYDPRYIVGVFIFLVGYYINRKADSILSRLRSSARAANEGNNEELVSKNPDTDVSQLQTKYKIPYGFLYEYVSCPNYLGEIMIWIGWAIASWTLAGLALQYSLSATSFQEPFRIINGTKRTFQTIQQIEKQSFRY